ncbi:MAG: hypothetical protein H0V66_15355 [Bdellovibrionales bacterium]|nr:hypothetical protein [Bdellovibrionales bacterium]
MKSVFFLSLMSLSVFAWSATQEWKVVAETTNACKDKIQVLAKEGEKFVYVADGNTKTKLFADDGSAFTETNGKSVTYSNANDKTLDDAAKRFTFVQPSMVDGNPAKLDVAMNGVKDNCKMKLK